VSHADPSSPSGRPPTEEPYDPGRPLPPEEIERRFHWARRRGHPFYVWPDVPIPAWRSGLEEIERVTSRVLGPEGRGVPPELAVPPGASLQALSVAAFTSGLGPLLGRWLEERRIRAEEEVTSLMDVHLAHARDRARREEQVLARTVAILREAGVERVGVLKGAHTGRTYFPEPGSRPSADVDVVVPEAEYGAAEAALSTTGHEQVERQPRPRRSGWRPPGEKSGLHSLELTHRNNPIRIDLHDSLRRDFFGVRTVDLGPVEEMFVPWREGPPGSRILSQPALTGYLAAHASEGLHGLTLLRLVELVLVIRADTVRRRLTWEELDRFLEEKEALRFVYPAFILAERLGPGTVEPAFLRRLEDDAPLRMVRVLAGMEPSGAQRFQDVALDERFMWVRGPVEAVRRMLYMIRPAWAGTSLSQFVRIYSERIYRLLRGRVGVQRAGAEEKRKGAPDKEG